MADKAIARTFTIHTAATHTRKRHDISRYCRELFLSARKDAGDALTSSRVCAQAQMWAGSNLDGLRLARTEQGDIEGGCCDQRCVGGARRDQHEDDEGDEIALRGPIQAR